MLRIEEALIRSENNIRIYTDNVPALIAYFDKECRYLFTNRAYEQAFNIDRNAVIGEVADLWFHTMVMLSHLELDTQEVLLCLGDRFGVSGLDEKAARDTRGN